MENISRLDVQVLEANARALGPDSGLQVELIGFTDGSECSGTACDALGMRRAKLIFDWLKSYGLTSTNVKQPRSNGQNYPIDDNSTEEGRRRNRRVEFYVKPIGWAPSGEY